MRHYANYEDEASKLRKKLPPLTLSQLNWVMGQHYERTMARYTETKKKVSEYEYYAIVTTLKGWQIVRYILLHSEASRNGYKLCYCVEASQRWMKMKEDGQIHLTIFEKRYAQYWYNNTIPYAVNSPLSWKPWGSCYDRKCITAFNLWDWAVYPNRKFAKDFVNADLARAIGRYDEIWLYEDVRDKKHLKGVDSLSLDKTEVKKLTKKCYLPTIVETLFKIGEPTLARMMLDGGGIHGTLLKKYWVSFLIARRHGLRLTPSDWQMWLDYVSVLDELGKDIRSPKYLLPDNLYEAHAKYQTKMEEIQRRIRLEAERRTLERKEAEYKKRMQSYFGIIIATKSGLTITPLKSVEAFLEEGDAMHHCVYTNGYYKKDHHCLILSAKDKDGKRVETIRVNLPTMSVAESRGVCNKPTEFHDEIVKAMEANMWQIEKVYNETPLVVAKAS